MAEIKYHGIKKEVQKVLMEDVDLNENRQITVTVERENIFSAEMCPWINIVSLDREVDEDPVAAGTIMRLNYRLRLLVVAFHPESLAKAAESRDKILGLAEIVLMRNRTLNNSVSTLLLEGGDIGSAEIEDELGFLADAEIDFFVKVTAETTSGFA